MRKNQIQNRKKRKGLNKLKAPVDRTKNRIESIKRSIKTNIFFVVVFCFLFILFFMLSLMSYHTDWWQKSEIIYQSHYYIPERTGLRGVRIGGYYIVEDNNDKSWHISWAKDFDIDIFEADVKQGDTLKISWHYWFIGRSVQSLESDNYSYRSFSDAEKISRDDIFVEITFTIILAAFLLITITMLIFNIRKIKKLKAALEEYKKNLEEWKNKF